jgi:hypothetical protein
MFVLSLNGVLRAPSRYPQRFEAASLIPCDVDDPDCPGIEFAAKLGLPRLPRVLRGDSDQHNRGVRRATAPSDALENVMA